jgi:hypothetical protein
MLKSQKLLKKVRKEYTRNNIFINAVHKSKGVKKSVKTRKNRCLPVLLSGKKFMIFDAIGVRIYHESCKKTY